MKQSRVMSLVEAISNVSIGYGVAVATQILVFPWFGMHITLAQNLKLAMVFTLISIIRSFALRRLFEAIRARKTERQTAALAGRRRQNSMVFRHGFCKPVPFPHRSRR